MKGIFAMSGTPLFPATVPAIDLIPDLTAGFVATVDVDLLTGWNDAEPLIPADLSVVSTRELRILCNQLYSALDVDFPPYGAQGDYAALVNELEQRAARARL
jgi:hypothetical protein